MRTVCKKIIILAAVLLIFILNMPVQVLAAEQTDWDSVDWTQYDWVNIDNNETRTSLANWLKTEASFEQLFAVYKNLQHAAFSETLSGIISERFCLNTDGMIGALTKESAETQDDIVFAIVFGTEDPMALKSAMESVLPAQLKQAEVSEIFFKLADKAKELLGIEIQNPQTGDPFVGTAIAMLVVSGLGTAVLCLQKKNMLDC